MPWYDNLLVTIPRFKDLQRNFIIFGSERQPLNTTLKGLIFAELNFRGINFREFLASNSRKLIPWNSLKMTNSRKLIPRKYNSIIYFPKILKNWQKEQVNHKKWLCWFFEIRENWFRKFSENGKFAKINSAKN